ncbi:glutathione S-transferase family protein [Croceibacterium aestuarii]|uniref:glutathione S-transferase family protein n=1 Tax=Croceibacterium aestuarii TaxID=3064139 RepID=UPI00272E7EB3|nr:glutathione S-transferase family protein [Croceibacterium sp. D39]
MITIYHAPNSRSLRVLWLMEELGEDYRLETVTFPVPPEYLAVNPAGCVPAISDDGIAMFESIAILQYLTGRLLVAGDAQAAALTVGPRPDPAAYAEHLQFLHFGESDLTVPVGVLYNARRRGAPDHPVLQFVRERLAKRLAFLDDHLADEREWVTGEHFTIADISLGYALFLVGHSGIDVELPGKVAAYWRRLQERPAWQRAKAR